MYIYVYRFYNIIKDMYLQVTVNGKLTPTFTSILGVRQGDNLSPTLYNIFNDDIPNILQNCRSVKYGE